MEKLKASFNSQYLSNSEEKNINQRVTYELTNRNYHLLRNVSIISLITPLLPIWAFYDSVDMINLISWSLIMWIAHISCIAIFYYYKNQVPTAAQIKSWLYVLYFATLMSTLAWGSVGVLLVPNFQIGQIFILFFLIVIASSIAIGTSADYLSSVIGLLCSLVPYISLQFYQGIQNAQGLHIQLGIILIIYMIFLHIVSYVGYRLMKKSVKLSFTNVALAEKLETANTQLKEVNNDLEHRVQERTYELREALKTVTYQAEHDLITDLPNQRMLDQYLDEAIKSKQEFGVAFFSINRLNNIDDSLGHHEGDVVIKSVAERLVHILEKTKALKGTDCIVTLPRRDVFVILLQPLTYRNAENKVNKIFSVLEKPVLVNDKPVRLTASIGLSLFQNKNETVNELLSNADIALSRAKKIGNNKLEMFGAAELSLHPSEQLELENNLYIALDRQELEIHYQPLVGAKTGLISGMEALTRWRHQDGMIMPSKFIPVAEETGLIIPLGEWVLYKACQQTKLWHDQGFNNLKVAVNVSAKQLLTKNIVETVKHVLQETGLNPKFLELELTESMSMVLDDKIKVLLKQFKEIGVSLSMDDFGTGFSGLSYLKLLSIDKLKIDISFVRDITTNPDSKAIVSAILAMTKKLDITSVAEGVEHIEQLEQLKKEGCDLIQGYYFSRPLQTQDFTEFLIKHYGKPIS